MADPISLINSKIFAEHLHTKFTVRPGNGQAAVVLELDAVEEYNFSPRTETFSLFFRGPEIPLLHQQIHQLAHEKLGTFHVFLTPLRADREGTYYESAFNRIRKNQTHNKP